MTLAGPLVGPEANPGAGEAAASEARRWAVILCGARALKHTTVVPWNPNAQD